MNPKLMISKQPATHSAKTAEPWQLAIRDERAVGELVGSVTDALAMAPTSWVPSFLGLPSSWGPAPYSEYELLWSGDVPRLARYLVDVGIPSVPGRAPGWVPGPLASLFWHPSHVDRHPDENGRSDSHPREAWFFINGILHDDALAQMNGDYLAYLFHRPITLLQNSTDGALVDLLECAVERLGATAEDVDAAFPPLMKALKDPEKERVVVIVHSQGTLILAVVLELIKHIYARTSSNRLSDADVDAIHRRTRAEGMRFDRRHIKPLNARELGRLEWDVTVEALNTITGATERLADTPVLARAITRRVPYIAPLNHLQIELIRRWRRGQHEEKTRRAILIAINGVAAGLRNTG